MAEGQAQGVALVAQVIDKLQQDGLQALSGKHGVRTPHGLSEAQLDALRLPDDRPLSPSLRAFLAFDATFLGLFSDLDAPAFQPLGVGELAAQEYGEDDPQGQTFASLQKHALKGLCLLIPFGSDSRRFLYLSEPDALGEYPVLLIDIDDMPFVTVEYPGLDVYLATHASLIKPPQRVYGSYADDPRFADRMAHHIKHALAGHAEIELHSEGFPLDESLRATDD